jgi:hypothetical protein
MQHDKQHWRGVSSHQLPHIQSIPPADFACDNLNVTLQDGPIDLLCPDFNLRAAKIDTATIKAEISLKIICSATPSVIDHLYLTSSAQDIPRSLTLLLTTSGRHTKTPMAT